MAGKYLKVIIGILLYGAMEGCSSGSPSSAYYESVRTKVKDGDIVLRRGRGWISDMICSALNDSIEISHCGIAVVDSCSGSVSVIHSLSGRVSDLDGVQSCSLREFVTDAVTGSVIICRFRNDSSELIAVKARDYLSDRVPFDDDYDIKNNSKLFCSELPIVIINDLFGVDILPENSKTNFIPRFSVFVNEDFFTVISP